MGRKLLKKVVKLKDPILIIDDEGNETKLTKIVLNKPKVKHLRNFPESFLEKEGEGLTTEEYIQIIQAITGLNKKIVDEIGFDDLETIGESFQNFFRKSQPIGKE